MLKVTVKNNRIVIELPFDATGTLSKEGKSMVHASTRGNKAVALPDGTQLTLGVNAYTPNPDYVKTDKKK